MKQSQAITVLMSGRSVFLTGAPGAGKSFTLNRFVKLADRAGRRVAVTASTGIAATHIGGTTIHAWSGLGVREALSQHDLDVFAARDRLVKRFVSTDILIIDEVSMLSGRFLDMLNLLAKRMRDSDLPFGGIQMVLVGDMFQLPPVNRGVAAIDFAHESAAWQELNPAICYITEQHRQVDDPLLDLLEAMRSGQLDVMHQELLQGRMQHEPDASVPITRLYAHNMDVDSINQRHLAALSGDSKAFIMSTKGPEAKVEQLARGVLAPASLQLKVGAEVMFVANDFAAGFANGSRGQVVRIDGDFPEVELHGNHRLVRVEPHTWQLAEDGRVRAEVTQLPLRLAWAITIHKSQGMSMDAADIDLSRTFTPGMGYVALSRVRSLEGIYLRGINAMALQLHPDIYELDQALKQASAELALGTDEYVEPETSVQTATIPSNPELLRRLKAWRTARAEAERVPAYIIAHNSMLEQIAIRLPLDAKSLMAIKGIGVTKVEKIGEDLLAITREFADAQPAPAESPSVDQVPVSDSISPDPAQDAELAAARAAKIAETKALYPNSGRRWQPAEEQTVLDHLYNMTPLAAVCDELQRSPGSVWAHVGKLLNDTLQKESE